MRQLYQEQAVLDEEYKIVHRPVEMTYAKSFANDGRGAEYTVDQSGVVSFVSREGVLEKVYDVSGERYTKAQLDQDILDSKEHTTRESAKIATMRAAEVAAVEKQHRLVREAKAALIREEKDRQATIQAQRMADKQEGIAQHKSQEISDSVSERLEL